MDIRQLQELYPIWEEKYKNSEWFPIVNERGEVIGKAPREICHNGKSFLLHPVVHLHVFSSKGELLLQKRKMNKKIQPGKWDTSVGGHISYGEDVYTALKRETEEEIGITPESPKFLFKYVWESNVEKELIHTYTMISDGPFNLLETELEDLRFWNIQEIKQNLGKGVFTPNFEHEFKKLLKIMG